MALTFDAPGDDAAALLRAQELGCVPEMVLALVALTDHRLVGSEADGGILHTEAEWPAAWRVHAARCHEALAAGCQDDIDILLRVFSEWQTAPDPDGWCATWWVNPRTIRRIEADVVTVIAGLASSGPVGLRHPVDVTRAPSVRMALAEAYAAAEYVPAGIDRYRSATGHEGAPYALSPTAIVPPTGRFIAIGRDSEARLLQHLVALDTGSATPNDDFAPVRASWPVGSIAEIETLGSVPGGRIIIDMLPVQRGFAYPEGPAPVPSHPSDDIPELVAAPAYASAPVDTASRVRVRIVGYRTGDKGAAILVVDPLQPGAPLDPAEHPDLGVWDDIEVVVRGAASDHFGPMLELARSDGLGSFYIAPGAGLDAHDATFGNRIKEGTHLTARVVPEPPSGGTVTLSLLPVALRQLQSAIHGEDHEPLGARLVERDTREGLLTVELANADTATGISHRFTFATDRLTPGFDPAVGSDLEVVLRPDRSDRRHRISASPELIRFAERNHDTFRVVDGWLRMAPSPPQIPAILALLSLSPSAAWEREVVWMYEDSLHLEIALAGAAGDPTLAATAAGSPGFLLPQPKATHAPTADEEPAVVEGDLPKMVALLPPGAAARIVGSALAELRAAPGLVSVDLDGDIVTVVGETGRVVRSTITEIERIILPAKGKLVVPPGQGKRLIGIDGTTLRAIEARTGCIGTRPDEDGGLWSIEGPSSQAVKEFIRLASQQVPGVAGRVTEVESLRILEDHTIPASIRASTSTRHDSSTPVVEPAPEPIAAALVETAEPVAPEVPVADDDDTPTASRRPRRPIKPKSGNLAQEPPRKGRGRTILGWLLRAIIVLLVAGAVAVAAIYAIPLVRDAVGSSTTTAPAPTATTSAGALTPFVELVDATPAAPASCWLAVFATWDDEASALQGVDRLADAGVPAFVLPSERVPSWAADKVVAALAVETPSQAADAVARGEAAGYGGVTIESSVDGCAGLDIVPGEMTVGLGDLP